MILQIDEKWRVASGPHAWMVEKYAPVTEKERERGRTKDWEPVTWHVTLDQAVQAVFERKILAIPEMGAEETLRAIYAVQRDVYQLAEKFKRIQEES